MADTGYIIKTDKLEILNSIKSFSLENLTFGDLAQLLRLFALKNLIGSYKVLIAIRIKVCFFSLHQIVLNQ